MTEPLALIIEDDPQLSQIFTFSLQPHFATEMLTDGQSAMERLAVVSPTVVVLDLHLPGVMGRDILAYIRSEPRLAATQVILATADARQAEFLTDQADIVLLKPVSPVQLREIASRLRPAAE